tara:strand:+ start:2220 stop:2930 length:711 start_codon:yes stop_codon:yes gene_type:complete
MRLINRTFVLITFTILAISCSNNKPSDYSTLKQKALEIPPDFQLEPPAEGEEEVVDLPGSNESQDIQTILEDSSADAVSSDEVTNKDMSLEEFVEENFLAKKETEQEDEAVEKVDESALANEAEEALKELMKIIEVKNEQEEINLPEEEEIVAEETPESISEDESEETSDEVAEDFNEEEFLEDLADTEDITSLPEEEQLQPMILDDMPVDNTDFGDEDLNDLLDRVDDLLNSYSN